MRRTRVDSTAESDTTSPTVADRIMGRDTPGRPGGAGRLSAGLTPALQPSGPAALHGRGPARARARRIPGAPPGIGRHHGDVAR